MAIVEDECGLAAVAAGGGALETILTIARVGGIKGVGGAGVAGE